METYGGSPGEWTKEKAFYRVYDEYGEERTAEIHWYAEPSVGRVEDKVKLHEGRVYLDD